MGYIKEPAGVDFIVDPTPLTAADRSFIISGGCDIICSSGAIKIKLSSRHPLYKEACVFVGVPCFEEMTDSLKNKQLWKLHKIPLDDNSCFWTEVSMNIYDSKGVPFYVMD